MRKLLLFVVLFSCFGSSAVPAGFDCTKEPTFLRKVPGGHAIVYHPGCEPKSTASSVDGSTTGFTAEDDPVPCVGVCYGVKSHLTGESRDSYVRGHYRRNGTYVAPYTRSRRAR